MPRFTNARRVSALLVAVLIGSAGLLLLIGDSSSGTKPHLSERPARSGEQPQAAMADSSGEMAGLLTAQPLPGKKLAERVSGIGAALRTHEGKLLVFKVLPDSPAALSKAFQPDDQIVAVAQGSDGEFVDVAGLKFADAVAMIRGPIGSVVRLIMIPSGETERRIVSLVRGEIDALLTNGRAQPLPPGSPAPNFKVTRLADGQEVEATQFAGQVVVLEFWSTNCRPCIGALDNLQYLQTRHPEWDGKVQFLAVSIDEAKKQAERLFHEKKWTGFDTVWAGPSILDQYYVNYLPKVYVIEQDGRIAANGSQLFDISEEVNRLLDPAAH